MSAANADMLLLTPLERVTSPLAWLDEYRLTYSPSPPSSLALSLYRKTRGRTAQALTGVRVKVWFGADAHNDEEINLVEGINCSGGPEIKGHLVAKQDIARPASGNLTQRCALE